MAGGYLTLFAGEIFTPPRELYKTLLQSVQRDGLRCSSYQDETQDDFREVALDGGEVRHALFLHRNRGRLPATDWMAGLLTADRPAGSVALLAGLDAGVADKGRLICTCLEIGERQIEQAIVAGACDVDALGQQLGCGTECGSCVPELRRLLLATGKKKVA